MLAAGPAGSRGRRGELRAPQYHMVYAAKGVQVVAALEAGIPDTAAVVFAALGIALALHGKRALRPRALNLAAVATSIFMNFAAAAGTNWRTVADLGHARRRVCRRVRYGDRRHPGVHDRPAAPAGRGPGRRGHHPAGRAGRGPALAPAPGPGAGVHPDGLPGLGRDLLPGRAGHPGADARPPERGRAACCQPTPGTAATTTSGAGPRTATSAAAGTRRRKPRASPRRPGSWTWWPSATRAAWPRSTRPTCRSSAPSSRRRWTWTRARPGPTSRPASARPTQMRRPGDERRRQRGRWRRSPADRGGRSPGGPDRRRRALEDRAPVAPGPGRARRPRAGVRQVGVPAGQRLPQHRTRHCGSGCVCGCTQARWPRDRLRLWWRWSARAIRHTAGYPSCTACVECWPARFSVLLGFAHYRLRLRIPLDEHAVVLSPPRKGKSGWLARVINHYPGPVVTTTTKADVFSLTSGIRERRRPDPRVQPAAHRRRALHVPLGPAGAGARIPATAIRRADAFALAVSTKGMEGGGFRRRRPRRSCAPCSALPRSTGYRMQRRRGLGADRPMSPRRRRSSGTRPEAVGGRSWPSCAGRRARPPRPIQMTMTQALGFLTDPAAGPAGAAGPGLGPGYGRCSCRTAARST